MTHPAGVGDRRSTADEEISVTSLPGLHAPDPLAKLLPPVMGSLLEFDLGGDDRFRLYITEDTLIHDRLHEIPRRYPEIDLALLHLGGTKVMGILLTMDGAQGVQLLELVRPRMAVPIHFDDYSVFKSPLHEFENAIAAVEGLDTDVTYPAHGDTDRFRAG